MTPGARVAAAIEILDSIFAGDPAEKALTHWGRTHRFAGSKDRAAIRDHVFDALRCRSSYGWRGGADTGRGVMLGAMRTVGQTDAIFTGDGHSPPPVQPHEQEQDVLDAPRHVRLDMPEWLLPHFDGSLGAQADEVLIRLQSRAGIFLRVNLAKGTREDAIRALAEDGIATYAIDHINTALQVTENARRVAQSRAYFDGLVEVQDASSQAAIEALSIQAGQHVLDFCAGGGGKGLAVAAHGAVVYAHDIDPRRMKDIEPRAQRAGVQIEICDAARLAHFAPYDVVLCDAPCSGSGTWRRNPVAKWDLSAERLSELTSLQLQVLNDGAQYVREGQILAYATCSVFDVENKARVRSFVRESSNFELLEEHHWLPGTDGDGFYLAVMRRMQ